MMRLTRRFLVPCLLVVFAILVQGQVAALGEPPDRPANRHGQHSHSKTARPALLTVSAGKASALQSGKLYLVSLRCGPSAEAERLMRPPSLGERLMLSRSETVDVFLLFHTEEPAAAAGGGELPKSIVAGVSVFSAEPGNVHNGFDGCKRSFVVNGDTPLWATAVVARATSYKPGALFAAIDSIVNLSTPLATLLSGGPIAAATTANDQIQKLKDPLGKLLGLLDTSAKVTQPFPIEAGTTNVKSVAGWVRVVVTPIPSLVAGARKDPALLQELNKKLGKITARPVPGPDLAATCRGIVGDLSNSGIRSPTDIAYSLVYLSRGLASADQVLTCLGEPQYAFAAAGLDHDALFAGLPAITRVTTADCDSFFCPAEQPALRIVQKKLDLLTSHLPLYPGSSEVLSKLFTDKLAIENATARAIAGLADTPVTVPAAMDALGAEGFRRFGCYAQAPEPEADCASTAFLMFDATPTDRTVCLSKTFMVRPFFSADNRIEKLKLSGNLDWIRKVLAERATPYSCGDARITVDPGC